MPHLPTSLEPLGNSAAPWILVAFVVALTARSMPESLLLAIVALVSLVAGFYVAEAIRGWPVSRHQVAFWCITSVVAGPLVGVAAAWLRRDGPEAGALGAGIIGGVLAGEAVRGLTTLRYYTPAHYWRVQLALGITFTVGVTLWRLRNRLLRAIPAIAISMTACAVVGIGTLVAYQVP